MQKETGLPLAEGLETANDLPHTIASVIMYKIRIESFGELPRDKRPPRKMWDRPNELSEFLQHVWDTDASKSKTNMYEYNLDDIE